MLRILLEDRARLARLESQWAAHRQAQARVAQQHRYETFWAKRLQACDELIAMASHLSQPAVAPAQAVELYDQGSARLGSVDFVPTLLADPARWF
jgi:hypothetical protein